MPTYLRCTTAIGTTHTRMSVCVCEWSFCHLVAEALLLLLLLLPLHF